MRFSLIIPTFNRSAHIDSLMKSLFEQSYSDFEIILVDDGSTDDTAGKTKEWSNRYPGRIHYLYQENGERGKARNTGMDHARGEYLTFLDSDDLLYSNHFEVADRELKKNSPPFFALAYEVKEKNKVLWNSVPKNELRKSLFEGNFLSCMGVFLRKDLADQFRFNPDRKLSGMEDWELWLRIISQYDLIFCPEITSCIIQHEERSVSTDAPQKIIEKTELIEKMINGNEQIKLKYKSYLTLFNASCASYIALHLALTKKNRSKTAVYFLKTLKRKPGFIFSKRAMAIIKHFV